MKILSILIVGGLFGWGVFVMFSEVYSWFNHSVWSKGSKPNIDAKVVKAWSKPVIYVKNGAKMKTTVVFSDGFRYVTFKTNRKDGFGKYRISSDESEIIIMARDAHWDALEKLRMKGEHIYTKEEIPEDEESFVLPTTVEAQPIPQGGWRCTCGRSHQAYESSCVCGVSKSEVK